MHAIHALLPLPDAAEPLGARAFVRDEDVDFYPNPGLREPAAGVLPLAEARLQSRELYPNRVAMSVRQSALTAERNVSMQRMPCKKRTM
jgi:hypothetical protein